VQVVTPVGLRENLKRREERVPKIIKVHPWHVGDDNGNATISIVQGPCPDVAVLIKSAPEGDIRRGIVPSTTALVASILDLDFVWSQRVIFKIKPLYFSVPGSAPIVVPWHVQVHLLSNGQLAILRRPLPNEHTT
jgi:hypothetical protein